LRLVVHDPCLLSVERGQNCLKRKLTPYALHPLKQSISLMMRHERKGGSAV